MTKYLEMDLKLAHIEIEKLIAERDALRKSHYTKDMELTVVHRVIDELKKELADTKLFATDNANWFDSLKVDYDKLKAEIAALRNQTPIAYIAWRDGKPYWSEDCVCADAVWPADGDDDRVSMPVYLASGAKDKTE